MATSRKEGDMTHEPQGHQPHGGHGHDHHASHGNDQPAAGFIDPVCGMTVAADSPRRFEFDATTYYFCSAECQKDFDRRAENFLAH